MNAPSASRSIRSSRVFGIVAILVLAAIVGSLFVFARQSGWTLGKLYLVLLIAHILVCHGLVLVMNPVVIARRMFPGPGVKVWDIVLMMLFLVVLVALILVARQDLLAREPSEPGIAWLIGVTFLAFGWALVTWSMSVNPFFEKQVRIQTNHGHHVIDDGPYRYIRHPGYVGFSAVLLATPLLLDSLWTLVPAVIAVMLLVVRTALEDRMLQAELPGYDEYAQRVRFRLVRGVW